jgi:hypothetical protein
MLASDHFRPAGGIAKPGPVTFLGHKVIGDGAKISRIKGSHYPTDFHPSNPIGVILHPCSDFVMEGLEPGNSCFRTLREWLKRLLRNPGSEFRILKSGRYVDRTHAHAADGILFPKLLLKFESFAGLQIRPFNILKKTRQAGNPVRISLNRGDVVQNGFEFRVLREIAVHKIFLLFLGRCSGTGFGETRLKAVNVLEQVSVDLLP